MALRVIEGGVSEGAPRPVVWNRLPRETCLGGRPRVLVLRDAGELVTIAIDDHRPFLVGVREAHPVRDAAAVQAWLDQAKGNGWDVRDERRPDPLRAGSISQAQALELERRKREASRRNDPLPAGGLFDLTQREQGELFR